VSEPPSTIMKQAVAGFVEHEVRQVEDRTVHTLGADAACERRGPDDKEQEQDPAADGGRHRCWRFDAEEQRGRTTRLLTHLGNQAGRGGFREDAMRGQRGLLEVLGEHDAAARAFRAAVRLSRAAFRALHLSDYTRRDAARVS
jgi:hypothetical protein